MRQIFWRGFFRRFVWVSVLVIGAMGGIGRAEGPRTGKFETTFTVRSRFSEVKSLTRRLKLVGGAGVVGDYDLGKETFLVYVPPTYDARKPMGLIVLVNYKHSDTLPEGVLPQLAEANVGLVVAKGFPAAWWQRAGMAPDAAEKWSRCTRWIGGACMCLGVAIHPTSLGGNCLSRSAWGCFFRRCSRGLSRRRWIRTGQ